MSCLLSPTRTKHYWTRQPLPPIMADLSRSDLIIYRLLDADRAVAVGHARPHSVSSVHGVDQRGQVVTRREFPLLLRVLDKHREGGASVEWQPGESVQREIWSVVAPRATSSLLC